MRWFAPTTFLYAESWFFLLLLSFVFHWKIFNSLSLLMFMLSPMVRKVISFVYCLTKKFIVTKRTNLFVISPAEAVPALSHLRFWMSFVFWEKEKEGLWGDSRSRELRITKDHQTRFITNIKGLFLSVTAWTWSTMLL